MRQRILHAGLFASLLGAAVMAGACADQSSEVAQLKADMAAQQKQFHAESDAWKTEREKLRRDLDDLKAKLGTLDGENAKPVAEAIRELEGRIAEAEKSEASPDVAAKLEALEAKLDKVKVEAGEIAREEAAKAGMGNVDEEKLAELTAKKLAEEQAASAPTKNLQEALNRLDVSEAEKDQVKQHILEAKAAILETLEVPTADGRNLAEELIDTILKVQNGKAEQTDMNKIFLELSTTKVPGDLEGRTYLQVIEAHKARNREQIGRILGKLDQDKLSKAHADWTDFEVGEGDPWVGLYMERLEKMK